MVLIVPAIAVALSPQAHAQIYANSADMRDLQARVIALENKIAVLQKEIVCPTGYTCTPNQNTPVKGVSQSPSLSFGQEQCIANPNYNMIGYTNSVQRMKFLPTIPVTLIGTSDSLSSLVINIASISTSSAPYANRIGFGNPYIQGLPPATYMYSGTDNGMSFGGTFIVMPCPNQ